MCALISRWISIIHAHALGDRNFHEKVTNDIPLPHAVRWFVRLEVAGSQVEADSRSLAFPSLIKQASCHVAFDSQKAVGPSALFLFIQRVAGAPI